VKVSWKPMSTREVKVFCLWRGFRKKHATPLWQPTVRLKIDHVTFLVHCRRGWNEVYIQRPGARGFTIVSVTQPKKVDFADNTLLVEYLMGVFDRLPIPGKIEGDKLPEDKKFLEHWPGILEMMTAKQYGNTGTPREPSSLFIVCEEGQFKVSISDKTRELSCWGVGATFQGALDCLEQRITSDSPEWRAYKGGRKAKRG
jgi:hypothetical protein